MTMYCDVQSVRRLLPEVTYSIVSDETVMHYIEDATSRIDDRIREIYDVPFSTVPRSIYSVCSQYAAYLTLTNFPDSSVEEDLVRLKEDVMEYLDMLQSGIARLPATYEISEAVTQPYWVNINSDNYTAGDRADQWHDYSDVREDEE